LKNSLEIVNCLICFTQLFVTESEAIQCLLIGFISSQCLLAVFKRFTEFFGFEAGKCKIIQQIHSEQLLLGKSFIRFFNGYCI